MQNVLIIGSSSSIAKAVARLYAGRRCHLFLVARNEETVREQKNDLLIRGASSVDFAVLDVTQFSRHTEIINRAATTLGGIDLALLCHGTLPDQQACEHDFQRILQEFNTNALSIVSLLSYLAPVMIAQKKGCLAVISSVAGDRGRQSNYIYGSAKATVSTYLQGLRGSLYPHHVHVLDIKPGFVDTPMTQAFKKGPLWAQPDTVASAIVKAVAAKRNTLYVPWFWRYIMLIICSIPEALFKRLKI